MLFWFKPATPTTTASATAAAANIFRFFNTAAPTADFINVYVEIAADKYVIGVKAKTTTGSATDD